MARSELLNPAQILAAVAAYFGQPVLRLTAPGGRSRSSYRAWFADHTIIVSQRQDPDQAAVERRVLAALQAHTDAVPRLLGVEGTLMFQSDVGLDRLNGVINTAPKPDRAGIAAQAVAAILDMHRAAHSAGLDHDLPVKGFSSAPDDDLTGVAARTTRQLALRDTGFDPDRLSPLFGAVPARFVKWDCRSGNAARDATGHLRWFDFEDARLAQGAEDFAWLLADETWPLDAGPMLDLIRAGLTPDLTRNPDDYMTYLVQYASLHALRRIRLIIAEARHAGWLDLGQILKFDRVGVNPHLGERLALRGADLAAQTPATQALRPIFEEWAHVFRKVREPKADV